MIYVKLWLDTRRAKKDGTFPLKLYVKYDNGKVLVSLPFSASEENWDKNEYGRKEVAFKAKNALLREYVAKAEEALLTLERAGKLARASMKSVKETVENALSGKQEERMSLWNAFDEFPKAKSERTIELYAATKAKLEEFDPSASFDAIDKRWLSTFDEWMKGRGLRTNTRSIHMRNLRAVFNYAIDEEITLNYPFRKFKIAHEATRKRSIRAEQIALLRSYDCEPYQRRYRDVFMLMFYLIGINAKDLFMARPSALVDGRIEYRRAKTGKLYSVKVEPEAMEIIERYRGKNYLLNIMDDYADYKDFLHRMNLELRKIGTVERRGRGGKKVCDPLFPEISSYWSRHSWATIAASLDIPKDTIAHALGHGGNTVTDIYIDFDQRKVDEANRRVIDYVNSADKQE